MLVTHIIVAVSRLRVFYVALATLPPNLESFMAEKKQPAAEKPRDPKVSAKDAEKVKGGMRTQNETCKETSDTGIMGCPG